MKKLLIAASLALFNCAYGDPVEETPTYGHHDPTKDNYYPDGGSSNYDPGGSVPYGCVSEEIKTDNSLPLFFVFCPNNPEFAYKWLVDPPPDKSAPK